MSSLFQPWNSPGIGMVTTMSELLQPIPCLLHACHGCYNQMCGCNNLKSNDCFNQVLVVSSEKHGITMPIPSTAKNRHFLKGNVEGNLLWSSSRNSGVCKKIRNPEFLDRFHNMFPSRFLYAWVRKCLFHCSEGCFNQASFFYMGSFPNGHYTH